MGGALRGRGREHSAYACNRSLGTACARDIGDGGILLARPTLTYVAEGPEQRERQAVGHRPPEPARVAQVDGMSPEAPAKRARGSASAEADAKAIRRMLG
jgi:hypothetical protein